MKLKALLVLCTSIVMSYTAFAAVWEKPIPQTAGLITVSDPSEGEGLYLYNVNYGGFLLGANDWGTRASVGNTGIAVKIVKKGDDKYGILNTGNGDFVSPDAVDGIWIDGSRANSDGWTITPTSGNNFTLAVPALSEKGTLGILSTSTETKLNLIDEVPEGAMNYNNWAMVEEADYQAWKEENDVYVVAMNLDKAIKDAKAKYPSIDLTSEETVFNNTTSTKDELQAALDAIKAVEENLAAWAAYKELAEQAIKMLNDGTYMSIADDLADYLTYDYTEYMEELELSTEEIKKEIATLQALYDNAKSETPAGTDITNMLKNTDFSDGWEGWEHYSEGGNVVANKDAKCAEALNSKNFDIHQDIQNAPVGVYQIQVQGFYRYNNGDDSGWLYYFNQDGTERTDHNEFIENSPAYVYLNDAKTQLDNIYKFKREYSEEDTYYKRDVFPAPYIDPNKEYWYPNDMTNASITFDDGRYIQSAFGLVAKKGDPLRIGVKGNTDDGTSWCVFTRFKLIYQGFDANIIKPELEKVMNSINAEALMGSDIAQEVKKVIEDGNAALAQTDGKVMLNALAAIYAIQTKVEESEEFFCGKEGSVGTTGIENIATSQATDIYTIYGLKLTTPQPGLNIIRTRDGVKKVMKK